MAVHSWVLVGEGTLLAGCGDILLGLGQRVAAVVTARADDRALGLGEGDPRPTAPTRDLASVLRGLDFDHLASIAHLSMIPAEALGLVRGLAVNFHDGPLPRYAGLNVTSWAILGRETTHGVTWHEMTARPDAGRLLEQRIFDVAPDETAFSLNAKCYAAGLESFTDLARRVAAGDTGGREQDLAGRSYFGRHDRPAAAAVIDWQAAADEIAALARALDFGPHPNPLALPKVLLGDGFVFVGRADVTDGPSGLPPGTVAAVLPNGLQVATRTADIRAGRVPRARRRRGHGRRGRATARPRPREDAAAPHRGDGRAADRALGRGGAIRGGLASDALEPRVPGPRSPGGYG